MVTLMKYKATSRQRNFMQLIKVSIFLETVLAIVNIRALIQFNLERLLQYLKRSFFSRMNPSIHISIATELLDRSNKTTSLFSVSK